MNRCALLWLGRVECVVGLMIVAVAGWLLVTHARHVGSSVEAVAARSQHIAAEIDATAATLEDHRDLIKKIRLAVLAYEQNVYALREASDDVVRQAAAWRALSTQVGAMFTDMAHLTDRVALAMYFKVPAGMKWDGGPKFTYARPLGDVAEKMHAEAKVLMQLGKALTKTADVTLSAVEKTHGSMSVSADETASALADVRELLARIEKERVDEWLAQIRHTADDVDRAGGNLQSVQPLAVGLTVGALLAGVFCVLNGVAILAVAKVIFPPTDRPVLTVMQPVPA